MNAARRSRNRIVLVLVLVLDCCVFDYEDEDDDEDEKIPSQLASNFDLGSAEQVHKTRTLRRSASLRF